MENEFICIVCPTGCKITAKSENGELSVFGNKCKRGESYVKQEMTNPTRVITSTVAVTTERKAFSEHLVFSEHLAYKRLPVKTSAPIKKPLIFEAMKLLDNISVTPPISCGEVIVKDILGTGIDFIATRSI